MKEAQNNQMVQIFEDQKVRTAWNQEEQQWYFSIVDVVAVLTDSADPKQYIKKLRARDPELNSRWGTICTPTRMVAADGKKYNTQTSTVAGVLRIIQSIPSKKAEPFKQWMAQVASDRIDQMQDPELSINQAIADYRRLGYSEPWIARRIKTIEVRKNLTDEWRRGGITDEMDFANLTDLMTKTWSGHTTREYKALKGLHKESLRDNMTTMELLLNALAEETATQISKERNPEGLTENAQVAYEGAEVARDTRVDIEHRLGRSVISSERAIDHTNPEGLLPINEEDPFA